MWKWKQRQRWKALASYLQLSTSRKKIVSSNTKDRIKWMICEATVFLMFWLHLDSQSFRIIWKFYFAAAQWCKQTIELLVSYLTSGSFFIIYQLPLLARHVIPSGHLNDVRYVCHMFRNSIFVWITSWSTCSAIAF